MDMSLRDAVLAGRAVGPSPKVAYIGHVLAGHQSMRGGTALFMVDDVN
jgi:hypothetical protein